MAHTVRKHCPDCARLCEPVCSVDLRYSMIGSFYCINVSNGSTLFNNVGLFYLSLFPITSCVEWQSHVSSRSLRQRGRGERGYDSAREAHKAERQLATFSGQHFVKGKEASSLKHNFLINCSEVPKIWPDILGAKFTLDSQVLHLYCFIINLNLHKNPSKYMYFFKDSSLSIKTFAKEIIYPSYLQIIQIKHLRPSWGTSD